MQGRGFLIVLEGLDCSGKTIQAKNLVKFMKKKFIYANPMHFPNRETTIGKKIDQYLKKEIEMSPEEVHVLFSENRREFAKIIRGSMEYGFNIVCDRYAHSGVAYSVAKGLDLEWCKEADRGLPAPDLVVFLDIDPKVAMTRTTRYGEEKHDNLEFQQKVLRAFAKIDDGFVHVDATKDEQEVRLQIESAVLDMIEKRPLQKTLWN